MMIISFNNSSIAREIQFKPNTGLFVMPKDKESAD